ncbi:MAG: phage portal protein, partial [Planctomycetota bacterium]
MSAEESQFLETRKFQRSLIAGAYRIPAHMIGDLEKATFSNIEQQALEFVVHSLDPYLVRHEKRIERDLLTDKDRADGIRVKFNTNALLRGDVKSRFEAYKTGREIGVYNANDIRAFEDLNPRDDEGGNDYREPLNMVVTNEGAGNANPTPENGNT